MKTKQHLIVLSLLLNFLLSGLSSYAQPAIQWQKCRGGTKIDVAYSTIQTNDGGYISVGETQSTNGDVTGFHGGSYFDVWLIKTDSSGTLQWQKCLGGTAHDFGCSIIQTSDGGYMVAGSTASNDGDVTGNHGYYDAWIVKLDVSGNIQWQKCLGGTNEDVAESILQTSDGGYIMAASVVSNDGDVIGNHSTVMDVWIVKLDAAGSIQWQKCLGGTAAEGRSGISFIGNNEKGICLSKTNDGGYVFTTRTTSNDGDVSGHHSGGSNPNNDIWVVKLDSTGTIKWQKSIGGTGGGDIAYSILQTNDNGYVLAGQTNSNDGDISGNHGGISDALVIKLDTAGSIQWQKCLGGPTTDVAMSINNTNDGGFFITGFTNSNSINVAGNHGGLYDIWTVKLDATGILQWQKCLGGTLRDNAFFGFQTNDGGYLVSGYTDSNNDDVSGNHAVNYDAWLVKLSPVPTHVIKGNVYKDLNGNCVKDSNEVGLSGKIIKAMPGNYFASTDANGNYTLFVDSGFYTISHIPSQYYNQTCPPSVGTYTANITSLTPNSYTNNFADTLTSHCPDLKLSIGTPFFRRCFKNNFNIQYSNIGAVAASNVSVSINFDNLIMPLSSSIPWTFVGTNYIFNIGTLQAGQTGSFFIQDSVSCAVIGASHNACALATIHSTTTECDTNNNAAHDCHFIVGSCDPNAKEVASQDFVNNGYVTQENCAPTDTLTYMLRFQNTGTDTAFTVVIRDSLSTYLNAASVESGASSHPYSFRIYGQGILEWTFYNILLPDSTNNEMASHGFIKFSVRQKVNNAQGTVINNSANIIFDYNAPVITDTAVVTIYQQTTQVANAGTHLYKQTAIIYPNPANNIITVKSAATLELITIYNSLGEIIYREKINSTQQQIDLSKHPAGIYILQTQNTRIKLIKE